MLESNELTSEEIVDFHRLVINELGLTPGIIRRMLKNPSEVRPLKRALITSVKALPTLYPRVHGVFDTAADVLRATLDHLVAKGFNLSQFTWIGSETPFDFTDDPEVAVALDVTLATVEETFNFAWNWVVEGQENSYRWEGIELGPDRLRLLAGSEAFQPFTLRWRRIKLDANVGQAPQTVHGSKMSPGMVLLFVIAQHPERVRATDYRKRFGWVIPGLECRSSGGDTQWQRRPFVYFVVTRHRVWMGMTEQEHGNANLAVPRYEE